MRPVRECRRRAAPRLACLTPAWARLPAGADLPLGPAGSSPPGGGGDASARRAAAQGKALEGVRGSLRAVPPFPSTGLVSTMRRAHRVPARVPLGLHQLRVWSCVALLNTEDLLLCKQCCFLLLEKSCGVNDLVLCFLFFFFSLRRLWIFYFQAAERRGSGWASSHAATCSAGLSSPHVSPWSWCA